MIIKWKIKYIEPISRKPDLNPYFRYTKSVYTPKMNINRLMCMTNVYILQKVCLDGGKEWGVDLIKKPCMHV